MCCQHAALSLIRAVVRMRNSSVPDILTRSWTAVPDVWLPDNATPDYAEASSVDSSPLERSETR